VTGTSGVPGDDEGTSAAGTPPVGGQALTGAAPDRADQPPPAPVQEPSTADKKTFLLSLLRTIGFRFTPGEELLYPLSAAGWLKVDLRATPLARAPWGGQYVLLPQELKSLEKDFLDIGHQTVLVDEHWDPRMVLESLGRMSGGQFRIWSSKYPLILNRGGVTLEMQADVLIRMQNNRVLLINFLDPGDPPTPSLLQAFLARMGVDVNEWTSQDGVMPKQLQAELPRQEDLLVPWIDRYNAWPEIRSRLGAEHQSMSPEAVDIDSVMAMLHRQGMVSRDPVRISWFWGRKRELSLIVPARSIDTGTSRLLVLGGDQATPHLVALLSLRGYSCLVVR
jgi:hypothetical protein